MRYYPWPASALTADEMAILYQVRETQTPRTPINQLLAQAVRIAYPQQVTPTIGDQSDDLGNTRQAA